MHPRERCQQAAAKTKQAQLATELIAFMRSELRLFTFSGRFENYHVQRSHDLDGEASLALAEWRIPILFLGCDGIYNRSR